MDEIKGGRRPGSGRKPLNPDDPTVSLTVRLTTSQKAKLLILGGGSWVRRMIEKQIKKDAKK